MHMTSERILPALLAAALPAILGLAVTACGGDESKLAISSRMLRDSGSAEAAECRVTGPGHDLPLNLKESSGLAQDRKSTRLNSSHLVISYAVFCLKKKKQKHI